MRDRFAGPGSLMLAALALGGGCADLQPLVAGACGNGVIDEGEECDTFADPAIGSGTACGAPGEAATACQYVCGTGGSESPACPTGWACSEDEGICRYATGQFTAVTGSPFGMPSSGLAIGDVDGDELLDLVGHDSNSLAVRFGAAGAQFTAAITMTMANPQGRVALADLDDDDRMDLVVPLQSGLFVMTGQPDRSLAPVAYAPVSISRSDMANVRIVPVRLALGTGAYAVPTDAMLMVADFNGTTVGMAFFDEGTNDDPTAYGGMTVAQIAGGIRAVDLDANVTSSASSGTDEVAIGFAGGATIDIYDTTPYRALTGALEVKLVLRQQVSLPVGTLGSQGFAFADRDGDGTLDLLAAVVEPETYTAHVWVAKGDPTTLQFQPLALDPAFEGLEAALPQGTRIPTGVQDGEDGMTIETASVFPIAAGDVNADGRADFVGFRGVYVSQPDGTLSSRAVNTRADVWSEAVIADFNRDGVGDVAAVSSDSEVDVLLGTVQGLFNRSAVQTDYPPGLLRVGDFDGDFYPDLALVQADDVGGYSGRSLSILFGDNQGAPGAPISMGRLGYVESIEPALIQNQDLWDMTSDLVVLSRADPYASAQSAAFMIGSAERRLLSPFTLSTTNGTDVPDDVLVGDFDSDDDVPDIAVLARAATDSDDAWSSGSAKLWLLHGAGDAQYRQETTQRMALDAASGFEAACALWAVGELDGDPASQEVVGIDQTDPCYTRSPEEAPLLIGAHLEQGSDSVSPSVTALTGDFVLPIGIEIADLDGDGWNDLLVTFAGSGGDARFGTGTAGRGDDAAGGDASEDGYEYVPLGAGVVIYWNLAGTIGPETATVLPLPSTFYALGGAVSLNADGDTAKEVALLIDNGIHLLDSIGARQFGEPVFTQYASTYATRLLAADVSGDGLDDLILASAWSNQVEVYRAVYNGETVVSSDLTPPISYEESR